MTQASRLKSLGLAGFALSFLPLSLICLCLNYAILALTLPPNLRARLRGNPGFQRRTILITGIGKPEALHLARAFSEAGHDVFGADVGQRLLPGHARFSTSLYKYHLLRHPLTDSTASEHIHELLHLIQNHNIELWVDCSQHTVTKPLRQAKTIIERRSRCLCFLPSDELAAAFTNTETFLAFTRSQGLPVLEVHQVGSRAQIHNVLNASRGKKRYMLSGPDASPTRAILPGRTLSQTYNDISKVKIHKETPWNLKLHVEGQEKYTTVGVVVKGQLKCFAASPLSTSHAFQALPPNSALNRSLLSYTRTLCEKLGHEYTGNIVIDFCTDETPSSTGVEKAILPMDGRTGPDASLLLFQGGEGSLELSRAYLSILTPSVNGAVKQNGSKGHDVVNDVASPGQTDKGFYSFGYDILQLVLLPLVQMLKLRVGLAHVLRGMMLMLNHVVFWRECVYEFKDPLPFWWLYQVYLPATLILSLFSKASKSPSANVQLMIR